jgi:hypothetical protein
MAAGSWGETRTVARLPSTVTLPIEPGHAYEFLVQAKDIMFFDKATGRRIDAQPL